MTLERIREKLREQAENPERESDRQQGYAERERTETSYARDIKTEAIAGTGRSRTVREETQTRERKAARKSSFWERLRKETERIRFPRGEKEGKEYALPAVPCVREPAPEWEPKYTKVLSVKKTESGPAMISQRNGETVFLTKFPFYVGSLAEYMDYVISQDTVSRFHAKFIRQGKTVLLSDLNSTNGTKVNGRELAVQEQIPLTNGDRILFADAEFVYFENQE